MIFPDSIVAKEGDKVEIEFDDKKNGYVFASLASVTDTPPAPSELGSYYFNHGLNTMYPITSFYK